MDLTGLSSSEVEERRQHGQGNAVEDRTSRSVASILRGNILTRFNAIITVLLAVVLVFGHLPDALFGLVMVFNTLIGIVQELRAKYTLDHLTVLSAPKATVLRDGVEAEIPAEDLVLDDVLLVAPGDQIPVDGEILASTGLQLDESLLTGEADPVDKQPGDTILSGSFVFAGSGAARAVAVGGDAYARRLADEAKRFTLTHSELRVGINRILQIVTWVIIPTAALLLYSQLRDNSDLAEGLVSAVAGVEGMVPQGLVLLVSLALAVAVIRLGKQQVLVQELPAVETLARVDVVCVDKTGTLTEGRIVYERLELLDPSVDEQEVEDVLAASAAAESNPNPTLDAIRNAFPADPHWPVSDAVPFSSARKYSGVAFAGRSAWYLGAPEIVLADGFADVRRRAAELALQGRRVLALVRTDGLGTEQSLPAARLPVALITLSESIRVDAASTVRYFLDQNVTLKVISGDDPRTVSTIAGQVGIPHADSYLDARSMPSAGPELVTAVDEHTVFGRVTPQQKQAMVGALHAGGHTVAMTGDGVNDVLALKDADIGIAMGSGTGATKSVAQLVLLDNRFATLPRVVAEGRRVVANMERVACLFMTKTAYATILAFLVGFAVIPFPFLPRHITLIGALTIGIPAFVLSFEPSSEPTHPGFVPRVLRFAIPSGVVAGTCTFLVYELARETFVDASLSQARTAATITLTLLAFWILYALIRPLGTKEAALVFGLCGLFVLTLFLPLSAEFFDLVLPPADEWVAVAIAVGIGIVLIEAGLQIGKRIGGVSRPA
ncbi:MAG: putative cation-transporting ATPase E [Acidimicrobiales bacterium]|nr:putative cation-transporting ATPase E [Acidimicrobiales bacterium]